MTRKRRSGKTIYNHKPATRESNLSLYPNVVAGDKAAIEEMILSNMPMVTMKVHRYLDQFPHLSHLSDDMLAHGYMALVVAVNKMVGSNQSEPNPTGYISLWIHREIRAVVGNESGIWVNRMSFLRNRKKNPDYKTPAKEGSLTVEDVFEKEAQADPRTMVDLTDELLGCCRNNKERKLLKLKMQNYSENAIAQLLGMSPMSVGRKRQEIYKRFLERNPEYRR